MSSSSSHTELSELRSNLKAMEFHKSRIACRIAEKQGITGYFFQDQLDLDNPNISAHDKETFLDLKDRIYHTTWEIDKLNNPERHVARRTAFDFINLLNLEESVNFLRKAGCLTTLELVEKLVENPNFIQEVLDNEEL